jgi:hypothetical protein
MDGESEDEPSNTYPSNRLGWKQAGLPSHATFDHPIPIIPLIRQLSDLSLTISFSYAALIIYFVRNYMFAVACSNTVE